MNNEFTHPAPSQPSSLYWHGREIKTQADLIALVKEWAEKGFDAASQPSAEALVQAALEAAAKLCDNHAKLSSCVIDQHLFTAARGIRALDKQKIIDGAGK